LKHKKKNEKRDEAHFVRPGVFLSPFHLTPQAPVLQIYPELLGVFHIGS